MRSAAGHIYAHLIPLIVGSRPEGINYTWKHLKGEKNMMLISGFAKEPVIEAHIKLIKKNIDQINKEASILISEAEGIINSQKVRYNDIVTLSFARVEYWIIRGMMNNDWMYKNRLTIERNNNFQKRVNQNFSPIKTK